MEQQPQKPLSSEELDKQVYSKIQETLDIEIHPDDEGRGNVLSTLHDYFMDVIAEQTSSIQKQLEEKERENERLRNDLLDALDVNESKGPTALSILSEELKAAREELYEKGQELKAAKNLLSEVNEKIDEN